MVGSSSTRRITRTRSTEMAGSSFLTGSEKKHWWLSNRTIVYKYIKDARTLLATKEHNEIASALNLLDAALALSPRLEVALELKARSLLYVRRFKDVADMLQDYIPSFKMGNDDSSSISSDNSSQQLSRERVKLLGHSPSVSLCGDPSIKCFSVSDLKKKVMASLGKNGEKQSQWRYLVLGQACCHLGLMEDALVLLQTGKRLASAAIRRESTSRSDDSFAITNFPIYNDVTMTDQPATPPRTETESINHLLSHIKFLLRRLTAAVAALDAGLYSESIRHFSKIVDSRRGAPQGFLAGCYMHRASAYKCAGRIAESIADCNRTLALDPACIQALETRAYLLETIRCLPDSLHDLEHLKLLYNSILRDRKLPGPAWKRHNVRYREITGKLCALTTKIQQLKQRVASGETSNVDYYALMGLRRGCSRSELQRAHLLLLLRHKPDTATNFMDRCEFADDRDLDSIRDRAKMSALLLYRLLQKGYTSVMTTIAGEEATEKQRKTAVQTAAISVQEQFNESDTKTQSNSTEICVPNRMSSENKPATVQSSLNASVYQGVFCRDLAVVGNLLSQVRFNRPITVKYEGLSC